MTKSNCYICGFNDKWGDEFCRECNYKVNEFFIKKIYEKYELVGEQCIMLGRLADAEKYYYLRNYTQTIITSQGNSPPVTTVTKIEYNNFHNLMSLDICMHPKYIYRAFKELLKRGYIQEIKIKRKRGAERQYKLSDRLTADVIGWLEEFKGIYNRI